MRAFGARVPHGTPHYKNVFVPHNSNRIESPRDPYVLVSALSSQTPTIWRRASLSPKAKSRGKLTGCACEPATRHQPTLQPLLLLLLVVVVLLVGPPIPDGLVVVDGRLVVGAVRHPHWGLCPEAEQLLLKHHLRCLLRTGALELPGP